MSKTCLVFIADGSEDMEAVTSCDILRRGEVKVTICGLDKEIVECSNGTKVVCDTIVSKVKEKIYDMIVVPGGLLGVDNIGKNEDAVSLIKNHVEHEKFIAAICAAPTLLVKLKLFQGKKATCYPALAKEFGDHFEYQEKKVVQDGKLITSQGPSTAVNFGLELIENLTGKKEKVSKEILFS